MPGGLPEVPQRHAEVHDADARLRDVPDWGDGGSCGPDAGDGLRFGPGLGFGLGFGFGPGLGFGPGFGFGPVFGPG